eukprot:CAMPEP_0174364040 /NCGR_PEP_ID=MMETSP0811_2-20130205/71262_1 /TAXON_ID=73025 ORGANISM="Eutreptiella gymnastica-like, Strain CCMP1594" /NCGR_SAMPLE_ID=MMETSP0811_2 /ASSEMBLY_ACC=CAM_ASM_000667 /LENGTH=142 /DNA_ID=CAMNT_0015503311 /DNA_START=350 /DNA_END=774 /DNA_ORIENTATION=+
MPSDWSGTDFTGATSSALRWNPGWSQLTQRGGGIAVSGRWGLRGSSPNVETRRDEPLEASSRHEDPASDVPGRNVLTPDVGVVRRTVLQAVWGPIVFGGAFVAAFRIISALVVRGYPKPPPLPDDSVVNAVGTLDTFYSAPA